MLNPPDEPCELCEAQPGEWCMPSCTEAPQPSLLEDLIKMRMWGQLRAMLVQTLREQGSAGDELLAFLEENWDAVPLDRERAELEKRLQRLRHKVVELKSLIREYVRTFETDVKESA